MKNNKGFTLVELIAVIAILVIVVVINIDSIKTLLGDTTNSVYRVVEERAQDYALQYIALENIALPRNSGSSIKIYLSELNESGYNDPIKDPKDLNTVCQGFVKVIKLSNNRYDYSPHIICGSNYINGEALVDFDKLNGAGNFENTALDTYFGCNCNATISTFSTANAIYGQRSRTCSLPGTFVGTGNNCLNMAFGVQNIDITHKYYIASNVYVTALAGSVSTNLNLYNSTKSLSTSTPLTTITAANTWFFTSGIVNLNYGTNANGDNYRIYSYVNSTNIATNYFDDIILLDLTAIFGAGKEPSKSIIDAAIKEGRGYSHY